MCKDVKFLSKSLSKSKIVWQMELLNHPMQWISIQFMNTVDPLFIL